MVQAMPNAEQGVASENRLPNLAPERSFVAAKPRLIIKRPERTSFCSGRFDQTALFNPRSQRDAVRNMRAAKGHGELVADLLCQAARLRKAKMMRI